MTNIHVICNEPHAIDPSKCAFCIIDGLNKSLANAVQQWKLHHDHVLLLEAQLGELTDLLRSAHCIAERKGIDTAWDRLAASIKNVGIGSITARTYKILPSDNEEEEN